MTTKNELSDPAYHLLRAPRTRSCPWPTNNGAINDYISFRRGLWAGTGGCGFAFSVETMIQSARMLRRKVSEVTISKSKFTWGSVVQLITWENFSVIILKLHAISYLFPLNTKMWSRRKWPGKRLCWFCVFVGYYIRPSVFSVFKIFKFDLII